MIHSLRAGVLSYVLAIGVIVSVVLSMITLFIYYARTENLYYHQRSELLKNLQSGIQIVLGASHEWEYDHSKLIDLYQLESDSIELMKKHWGLFDLYQVVSFKGDMRYEQFFTLAYKPAEEGRSAIYLVDDGRPVSLVGSTRIEGDCYLPLAGVQSAYINRIGYQNEELIYGERLRSEKELPEVDLETILEAAEDVVVDLIEEDRDTIINSFLNTTSLYEPLNDTLFGVYEGNVLIRSDAPVVFDSLSSTSDVVVIAPSITFQRGFKGSGQFLAADTIKVEEDVLLEYPSSLAIYNKNETALIRMEKGSTVHGWVLMDGEDNGFRRRVIYMEDGSEMNGMIYCNGMMEIYGQLNGHVTTKRFLVNSFSGVYENYIMNAAVNRAALDSSFLALSLWFPGSQAQVLKYLD